MRVLMINNDGGGFANYIEVPDGMTVGALFHSHLGERATPENYLIRVNRLPVSQDQTLCEGDRVSVTPVKIEGAQPGFPHPEYASKGCGSFYGVLGSSSPNGGGKKGRWIRKLRSTVKQLFAGSIVTWWRSKRNSTNSRSI